MCRCEYSILHSGHLVSPTVDHERMHERQNQCWQALGRAVSFWILGVDVVAASSWLSGSMQIMQQLYFLSTLSRGFYLKKPLADFSVEELPGEGYFFLVFINN